MLDPGSVKVISDLKTCAISLDIRTGRIIHQASIQSGIASDVYIASALMRMYSKCGSMDEARGVFDTIHLPDVVCWNALILGYAENGQGEIALDLLSKMNHIGVKPNSRTFVVALKACIELSNDIYKAEALYLLATSFGFAADIYLNNTLVGMYARCGNMKDARRLFGALNFPTVVSWNAVIQGYAANGQSWRALELFLLMRFKKCAPNGRTFVAVLKACADLATKEDRVLCKNKGDAVHLLCCVHGCGIDVYVENIIVDMYAKCGFMDESRKVFDNVKQPDLVCWNSLISGYANNGEANMALKLFLQMKTAGCVPDSLTFVAVLHALAEKMASLWTTKKMHLLLSRFGFDCNIYVQATLVDLYAKSTSMSDSQRVFDSVENPNVVCWNSLMFGYEGNGEFYVALELFGRMRREGCIPHSATFVAALKACAHAIKEQSLKIDSREDLREKVLKATWEGRVKRLHLLAARDGNYSSIYVQATLVDAYSNCGAMKEAQKVFDGMKHSDLVSWSALISGYADCGEGEVALGLFSRMRSEGCTPDSRAFLAALKACNVLGALEVGKAFHSEIRQHSFLCNDLVLRNSLVNFYAKCGSLIEAQEVFDSYVSRDLITWNALMSGYSCHGDTQQVFALFDRMQAQSIQPDGITFKCVLSVCSHAGLTERGKAYFDLMCKKFGMKPDIEHYNCMIDLQGRGNKLEDAMELLRSMPLTPNYVTWTTILGSCRKWKNIELGELAFESVLCLDAGANGIRTTDPCSEHVKNTGFNMHQGELLT